MAYKNNYYHMKIGYAKVLILPAFIFTPHIKVSPPAGPDMRSASAELASLSSFQSVVFGVITHLGFVIQIHTHIIPVRPGNAMN